MNTNQLRARLGEIHTRCTQIKNSVSDGQISAEHAVELDELLAEADGIVAKLKASRQDERFDSFDQFMRAPSSPIIPVPPINHSIGAAPNYQQHAQGGASRPTSSWRTPDGQEVRVLNKGDKLSDGRNNPDGLTMGGFMRAMVIPDPKYKNVLQEGTDSTGGYITPDILLNETIDLLIANSVLSSAGVRTMMLPPSSSASLARVEENPTPYWFHENMGPVDESSMKFGSVTFQPKLLICRVRASREIISDASNSESILMEGLAQALALEVDRVGLIGTGTGAEPRGILYTPGVARVDMGANGAAITNFDPYLQAAFASVKQDSPPPTAFVENPRTSESVSLLKDTTNQPLMRPRQLESAQFLSTTQIPTDDVQGSATDASRIYSGHWPFLIYGIRQQLQIELDRFSRSEYYEYQYIATMRVDYVCTQPAGFAVVDGIIP